MQEHRIILEEGNVISIALYAEDDPEKASRLVSQVFDIINKHPDEAFKAVVDLSHGSESAEPATLKIYKSAIEHPQIIKIAFVGVINEVQKVFADFAVQFSQKNTVQFFDNVSEAKNWLMQ